MLESIPESVQVGDQHYKLSPFSCGMQGTVSNIVKFGRSVHDSIVRFDRDRDGRVCESLP
jgi:hypothetical protein